MWKQAHPKTYAKGKLLIQHRGERCKFNFSILLLVMWPRSMHAIPFKYILIVRFCILRKWTVIKKAFSRNTFGGSSAPLEWAQDLSLFSLHKLMTGFSVLQVSLWLHGVSSSVGTCREGKQAFQVSVILGADWILRQVALSIESSWVRF